MTAYVFESVNLRRDNAMSPLLGGKEKMNLFFLFFPHPETNDTGGVKAIVMGKKMGAANASQSRRIIFC